MPGGIVMQFYADGMLVLWLIANLMIVGAMSSGHHVVARDWVIYSYAIALIPATCVRAGGFARSREHVPWSASSARGTWRW